MNLNLKALSKINPKGFNIIGKVLFIKEIFIKRSSKFLLEKHTNQTIYNANFPSKIKA